MMQYTTVQALGQARLADLHHQAQRDALARGTRRRRRGRRGLTGGCPSPAGGLDVSGERRWTAPTTRP